MTTSDLDPAFRPYIDWLLAVARAYTGGATLTSTRRGFFKQAALFIRYRGVQVCPPGSSIHESGFAVDLVVASGPTSPAQHWLGRVWNHYVANTWDPKDPVHFALRKGCDHG